MLFDKKNIALRAMKWGEVGFFVYNLRIKL